MKQTKSKAPLKIISFGGALMDTVVTLSDESLVENFDIQEKGGSVWLKEGQQLKDIQTKLADNQCNLETCRVPGGSACNVMKAISGLGIPTGFVGKVGQDALGEALAQKLKFRGVEPIFCESKTEPTGEVVCFVTPDGERTMRAYLGATTKLTVEDIPEYVFSEASLVHVEGYNIYDKPLLEGTLEMAKRNGLLVSYDIGSYQIARDHRDYILNTLKNSVHICFCNESEAKELFQTNSIKEAVERFTQYVEVCVVTKGKKGCFVGTKAKIFDLPAVNVDTEPIDTTGAGDSFCGAFLYGYISKYPIEVCCELGAHVGFNMVQVVGTELEQEDWDRIKKDVLKGIELESTCRFLEPSVRDVSETTVETEALV